MSTIPLLNSNYSPANQPYLIRIPRIKSGDKYHFTNNRGLHFEVSFGRKKKSYLDYIINFSIESESFDDEYSETNMGEVWRVLSTLIEIIGLYHENHPQAKSYEFTGEYRKKELQKGQSVRTRLFLRALNRTMDFNYWDVSVKNNTVHLQRVKYG